MYLEFLSKYRIHFHCRNKLCACALIDIEEERKEIKLHPVSSRFEFYGPASWGAQEGKVAAAVQSQILVRR